MIRGHFLITMSYLPHVNEPVMKGHLSYRITFSWILRCPLKTGFTVLRCPLKTGFIVLRCPLKTGFTVLRCPLKTGFIVLKHLKKKICYNYLDNKVLAKILCYALHISRYTGLIIEGTFEVHHHIYTHREHL